MVSPNGLGGWSHFKTNEYRIRVLAVVAPSSIPIHRTAAATTPHDRRVAIADLVKSQLKRSHDGKHEHAFSIDARYDLDAAMRMF